MYMHISFANTCARDVLSERDLPKECTVVRTDGAVYVPRKETVHGVAIRTWRETQDLVGDGTEFHACIVFLHVLEDIRMPVEPVAVADSLGAQQQSIQEIAVGFASAL